MFYRLTILAGLVASATWSSVAQAQTPQTVVIHPHQYLSYTVEKTADGFVSERAGSTVVGDTTTNSGLQAWWGYGFTGMLPPGATIQKVTMRLTQQLSASVQGTLYPPSTFSRLRFQLGTWGAGGTRLWQTFAQPSENGPYDLFTTTGFEGYSPNVKTLDVTYAVGSRWSQGNTNVHFAAGFPIASDGDGVADSIILKPGELTITYLPAETTPVAGSIVFQTNSRGTHDIGIVSPSTGIWKNLTNDAPAQWSPAISADGKTIAYVQGNATEPMPMGELWLMNSDGTNRRRLFGSTNIRTPSWQTGNSQVLLYASGATIYRYNIPAGNLQAVVPDKLAAIIFDPQTNSKGDRILFEGQRNQFKDVFVMDADGTNVRQVTTGTPTNGSVLHNAPRFAENGDIILTGHPNKYRIPANSWDYTPVDISKWTSASNLPARDGCISPDGKKMVFSTYKVGTTNTTSGIDLVRQNADGTGLRHLTWGAIAEQPDWGPLPYTGPTDVNPGQGWIYYSMPADNNDGTRIMRASNTGYAPQRVASGQQPAVTRDGSRLAYVSGRDVLVISTTGPFDSAPVLRRYAPLTLGNPSYPAWSPDGSKLSFQKGGNLFIYDWSNPAAAPVTISTTQTAVWSPDGQSLLVGNPSVVEAGASNFSLYKPDGTLVRTLPVIGYSATFVDTNRYVCLSPQSVSGQNLFRVVLASLNSAQTETLFESTVPLNWLRYGVDGRFYLSTRRTDSLPVSMVNWELSALDAKDFITKPTTEPRLLPRLYRLTYSGADEIELAIQ